MFNTILNLSSKRGGGSAGSSTSIKVLLIAALALPAMGTSVFASGLSGRVGGPAGNASAPREVDEVYEFGKALYLGRAPGSKKINYCVKVEGEPKKLRGRSLRSYKGAKQLDFANALYNCNQPEQLALLELEKEQVAYVLYYLNKRYKLNLDTGR